MSKLLTEFKEFAMRGNVVDMAVGVVVGGAFGKIVTSLVNDIIMPGEGVLTGGLNFSEYKYVIKDAVIDGVT
ncbi:MAG: large conductance mechanosensitive channel protein MscL, partial [Paramuribaculum sp.]|nr:large conductance mechanosensitive channel protein MscL [Paramuribaculum sp.]